ncbi:LPS export ABC transporter periplasmic protein LptC [bacterium]|nr:LPS export ABC transporter periplasmic protein LptC [bacterium]
MGFESIKQHIILVFFALFNIAIFVYSYTVQEGIDKEIVEKLSKQVQRPTVFESVDFYLVKDRRPSLTLFATGLTHYKDRGLSKFQAPKGEGITKDATKVSFFADNGLYNMNEDKLTLKDNVNFNNQDFKMKCEHLNYFENKDYLEAKTNVRAIFKTADTGDVITVNSDSLRAHLKKKTSILKGNVKGTVKRRRKYEESIKFASNNLNLDLAKSFIELQENVTIRKQQLTASSLRGEINLENYNKKLKYFSLYDDVKVNEKVMLAGDSYTRKAYAEKLEGIMSENKVVLTGYPRVYQRKDLIKGNKITLRENIEVVEVDDASSDFIIE